MPVRTAKRWPLAAACALLPCLAAVPAADAATGTLPGGTAIANTITSPADGATFQSPATVNLQGSASVAKSSPSADTTLIYVVDLSGSTLLQTGCGGDQNGDGGPDQILDCEIAAAKALNQKAAASGTVAQAGVVSFDSEARTVQALTSPSNPAITNALEGLQPLASTNFEAAAQEACGMAAGATTPNTTVVFLSDGFGNLGGSALDDLPCGNAVFQTFAIGGGSDCDNTGANGSLRQIAAQTGGTCTNVNDVSTLPDVVPGVIDSQLTKVTATVDGVALPLTVSPSLPKAGPVTANYSAQVANLAPGTHTICVTAEGSDAGGNGSLDDCVTITVVDPPKLSIDDVTVTEGDTGTVTARFTASLDKPGSGAVTANYATANGTAGAPADYAATSGALTFAPGQTTKTIDVTVKSDTVYEGSETFKVKLSGVSGAGVVDDTGIGTILDDDRNGTFSCRALGIKALGINVAIANNPFDPCQTDARALLTVGAGTGAVTAGGKVVATSTKQTPGNLITTDPALGDRAEADAEVANVVILIGSDVIRADVVTSHAEARCAGPLGSKPVLSGDTRITSLTRNGKAIALVDGKATVNLLLGKLYINKTDKTSDTVTQRAIFFDSTVLGSALDVVVAEAKAGFNGNPCQQG